MGKTLNSLLPSLDRSLIELGTNIKLARLRRKLSTVMLAERSGMTRTTLRSLENGSGGVSINCLIKVLHSLGLSSDLELLAKDDLLGRKLQDIELLGIAESEDEFCSDGKRNAKVAFNRAKLLNAVPDYLTMGELKEIENLYIKAAELTNTSGASYHVDHITPLNGVSIKGLHVLVNLQILTAGENMKKGNR